MKNKHLSQFIIIQLITILLTIGASDQLLSQNKAAVKWFEKGQKINDLDQKVTFYLKATMLDPSFAEAYYNLALTYENKGQLEKAHQFLGRALISRPNDLDNQLRLKIVYEMGVIQRKLGRYRDAKESLLGALNLVNKKDTKLTILSELGHVLIQIGNYDEAIVRYKQAAQLDPKNSSYQQSIEEAERLKQIDLYYSKGVQFLRERQFQKAIRHFEKALSLDKNFKDTKEKLNKAKKELLALQENERAWRAEYGPEAFSLVSKEERNKELGKKLEASMKKSEAKRKILSTNPAEISYQKGLLYLQNEQWEKAIKSFEVALSITPDYMDAEQQLQLAQLGLEQSTRNRILERYYNEGISLLNSQKWVKAIIAFEKVLELGPNYEDVELKLKQAQDGLEKEGVEIAKQRYYEQALLAFNDKDWVPAVTLFEKLQKLDANYKDTNEKLASAQVQLEESTQDHDIVKLYQQGEDALKSKDWLKAVIAFGKIEMINPYFRDVKKHLSQARDELNRRTKLMSNQASNSDPKRLSGFAWLLIGGGFIVPIIGIFILGPSLRGRLYLFLGLHDKASKLYLHLVDKGTISDRLLLALLHLYLLENRRDELVIKIYERTLRLNLGLDKKKKDEVSAVVTQHYIKNWELDAKAIATKLDEYLKKETDELAKITNGQ